MYRRVTTRVWDDPWFHGLVPLAKLIFLWCVTSHRTNRAGLIKVSPSMIAFELGAPQADIERILGKLSPHVEWWPEHRVLFVRRFAALQAEGTNRGNWFRAASRDLARVPAEVRRVVVQEYPELGDTEKASPLEKPKPRRRSPKVVKPSTVDEQVATLAARVGAEAPAPTPRPTDVMEALVRRLAEVDRAWAEVTYASLQMLIKDYGVGVVTSALREAWENRAIPDRGTPIPLLRAMCSRIRRERAEAATGDEG